MKLYRCSPICYHGMERNNFTFLTFLSGVYIYRQMLFSVDFAHILSFCNASDGSPQKMVGVVVMMMMMMVVVMMMMMSSRRGREYLRTVTPESVYKTPHLLLYSSISVHCHTANSLFRLPYSMLTVLYRNLPACHFHWRV